MKRADVRGCGFSDQLPTRETILGEFEGLDLRDARLNARAILVVERLSVAPHLSIPTAMGDDAAIQAAYRLLRNPRVSMDALLQPHRQKTTQRIRSEECVLLVHDTSEVSLSGEAAREDMGRLRSPHDQGFLMHVSLAVSADATRRPLGVLELSTWTRPKKSRKSAKGKKLSGPEYAKIENKESQRWFEHVESARQSAGAAAQIIHVADREADAFALLAKLRAQNERFVIRMARDRNAREDETAETVKVRQALAESQHVVEFDVPVSERAASTIPGHQKAFGERGRRTAKLGISALPMQLRRPQYVPDAPDWLDVNILCIREIEPPPSTDPIEWILLTSEPIDSVTDNLQILDFYRTRWLIEEFFKALKTGCSLEERQLESLATFTNALALLVPLAHHMLAMRALTRTVPDAPATLALSETQLEILSIQRRLPRGATVAQALYAVAQLGGYIKSKRPPGWLTLARGMERLLILEQGFQLQLASRSDQS